MSIKPLKVFLSVAKTGSFVAAARELELPPSSVSRYISSLEEELGQRLFYRHTRAVKLTEVGDYYFAEVREALTSLDLATEQVKGSLLTPQGNLNINAPVSFGRLHLSQLICQFQQRYPDINVELMLTDAYVDPVANGSDIVIRIGGFEDSSLNYQTIADEQFVLCAAPSYLETIKEHTKNLSQPKQLLDFNCLVYKGNNGRRNWFFRQEGKPAFECIEVTGNLCSNNADILVQAALAGQGIILFPRWLVFKYLATGELVALLESWEGSERDTPQSIYALYPGNRMKSSKVLYFLEFMSEFFGHSDPYWGKRPQPTA
jgi:DNA-binding transcriptional LysR family regulator|tara:strand:+ start:3440 stop:4390 length:951 start_codon:yes stop_codon:yes gene_type:complete